MIGENPMGYYVPLAQVNVAPTVLVLVARSRAPLDATIGGLRAVVRQTDRRVAVGRVSSMDAVVSTALAAEFGVRIALGATAARVLAGVVRGGLAPVAAGIALGVGGAVASSGALAQSVSLGGAAVAFLGVAVLAILGPGWRAARTDPMEALRSD